MQQNNFKQYIELTKPKVVLLILFTAVVGMFLAVPGLPPIDMMILGIIGIGFSSAAAAAVNHWADQKVDAIMLRTQHRPLPSGALDDWKVLVFALTLTIIGMTILVMLVNTLTAVLTFLSLIGYAFIYTFFLKRATAQNIVIGGAAGATPPVLGWAAVTGNVTADALLLFGIIFVWTPPHFWALAIYRKEDYAKANIPMLPVTHGVEFTQLHILLYTILLFIVTLMPYLTGMTGIVYLLAAVVLGVRFLWMSWQLKKTSDVMLAWKTFKFSIWYLMLIFLFLLIDHYLRIYPITERIGSSPLL